MNSNDFAASPLITPDRLLQDRIEALVVVPEWARGGIIIAPDLPLEQDTFVAWIGTIERMPLSLHVPSLAVLCELTRHGNSITTNHNRKANSELGRVYPKLTFAEHPEDTMPVARVVLDAGPHQSVRLGGAAGDLRPEVLQLQGAGKPTKEAREVAIRHAVELAHRAGANAGLYEQNLYALINFHDDLLLGKSTY